MEPKSSRSGPSAMLRRLTTVVGISSIGFWLLWLGLEHDWFDYGRDWMFWSTLQKRVFMGGTASLTAFACIVTMEKLWSRFMVACMVVAGGLAVSVLVYLVL